jgi:hypothetical protein
MREVDKERCSVKKEERLPTSKVRDAEVGKARLRSVPLGRIVSSEVYHNQHVCQSKTIVCHLVHQYQVPGIAGRHGLIYSLQFS